MNKKISTPIALIIIFVCAILVGGLAFWQYLEMPKVELTPEIRKPRETMEVQKIGKIYSIMEIDPKIEEKLKNYLLDKGGMQEMEKTRPGITESIISKAFGFSYYNNKYIISHNYSGGAHCCFDWFIFKLDENNNLRLITPSADIATAGNFYPRGEESLKEKNGKLYLVTTDDRFNYYCGSYVTSPFFKRYFKIENDSLLLSNTDFKEEFIKDAIEAENKLQNFYEEMKLMSAEEIKEKGYYFENWCPPLVERTVNYIVAREEANAWENFDSIFSKFFSLSSNLINIYPGRSTKQATSDEIKKDIFATMNEIPF